MSNHLVLGRDIKLALAYLEMRHYRAGCRSSVPGCNGVGQVLHFTQHWRQQRWTVSARLQWGLCSHSINHRAFLELLAMNCLSLGKSELFYLHYHNSHSAAIVHPVVGLASRLLWLFFDECILRGTNIPWMACHYLFFSLCPTLFLTMYTHFSLFKLWSFPWLFPHKLFYWGNYINNFFSFLLTCLSFCLLLPLYCHVIFSKYWV